MSADELRQRLVIDGFAVLEGVIPSAQLDCLRRAVECNVTSGRAMSRQVLWASGGAPPSRPPMTAIMNQWLNPYLYEGDGSTRAAAESVRPLADALLEERGVLFQDLLLLKKAGQGPFPWHQDFAFWPIDRPLGVIVWVPLVAADPETGALRFATGSHRLGPQPVVDLHTGLPQDTAAHVQFRAEDWPIAAPSYSPGDAAVFTPTTFHASPPMAREGERAAWSCIFLSPRARWRHANAPNHPLCKVVPDGAHVTELHHG